jgi:hypothetical protein
MRTGATLSSALMSLLARDLIDVDYIEVKGELEIEDLQRALAQLYNDNGRQMLDRHLPIGEADIALLEWTLARTPLVEAVTLESHLPDEAALRREVDLLRNLVTG